MTEKVLYLLLFLYLPASPVTFATEKNAGKCSKACLNNILYKYTANEKLSIAYGHRSVPAHVR